MPGQITFKRLSDNAELGASVNVTPYYLFRGMAVGQEYNYMYIENTGDDAIINPSIILLPVSPNTYAGGSSDLMNGHWCKVTAYGDHNTVLLDYSTNNPPKYWGTDTRNRQISASMAVGDKYEIFTKITCDNVRTVIGTYSHTIVIGGAS